MPPAKGLVPPPATAAAPAGPPRGPGAPRPAPRPLPGGQAAGAAAMRRSTAGGWAAGQPVGTGKNGARGSEEARRAQVTATRQRVFDARKADVGGILTGLDGMVDDQFGRGERGARETFTRRHK